MPSLRSFRLGSESNYRQIAHHGKRVHAASLTMQWIESPDGVCRFCFLARKKNGSAVYRNRCRRILRPIFFGKAPTIPAPVWAMIIVNDKEGEMTSERLHKASRKIFEKMGWV
ncbi:ribonuclease P protein component [Hallerella porci]|nr:ribonuclease P protein component [Hallerella porci]